MFAVVQLLQKAPLRSWMWTGARAEAVLPLPPLLYPCKMFLMIRKNVSKLIKSIARKSQRRSGRDYFLLYKSLFGTQYIFKICINFNWKLLYIFHISYFKFKASNSEIGTWVFHKIFWTPYQQHLNLNNFFSWHYYYLIG